MSAMSVASSLSNLPATALDNIAYFAVGMILGFCISRALVWIENKATRGDHPRRFRSPTPRAIVAFLSIVVGLMVFGLGVRAGYSLLNEQVQCFDDYADRQTSAQEPRQSASETLQVRQLEVFTAIERLLDSGASSEAEQDRRLETLRQALVAYSEAYAELEQVREDNPYPDYPREVCDG